VQARLDVGIRQRMLYAFFVAASDAETTFRISSERLRSFTARAITRAPTIVANVAIAFLRFVAAPFPGVKRTGNSSTDLKHAVTAWRTGAPSTWLFHSASIVLTARWQAFAIFNGEFSNQDRARVTATRSRRSLASSVPSGLR
jgi:hypothetical protein